MFYITFQVSKSKIDRLKLSQVYMVVTNDYKRLRYFTGIKILPSNWSKKKQRVLSKDDSHEVKNNELDLLNFKTKELIDSLKLNDKLDGIEILKTALINKDQSLKKFQKIFSAFTIYSWNLQRIKKQ